MRLIVCGFAIVSLTACGGGGPKSVTGSGTDVRTFIGTGQGLRNTSITSRLAPAMSPDDRDFGRMLNAVRAGAGAPAVTYNAQLNKAAQLHANDMLKNNYFSHTGRDGSQVADRVRKTGYRPIAVGENLAKGQQSDRQVTDEWANSAPHRDMMMAKTLKEFGLGLASKGSDTRWVLVMGTQKWVHPEPRN